MVATRDGAAFDQVESSLKARAASVSAPAPDVYVHIDEMPMTPTGKVRKGALRDMVIDWSACPSERRASPSTLPMT